MIVLAFWLFTKHFVVDYLLQGPWQYLNKGKLGHPGGVAHALLHLAATFAILILLIHNVTLAADLALAEGGAHYFIDWSKTNINKRLGWKCNNSEYFWWLLGLDQYLHALCYIAIMWVVSHDGLSFR